MYLDRLFKLMAEQQASDLFISCGAPISMKVNGVVAPLTNQPMDIDTVRRVAYELMSEDQARTFESEFEMNLSHLDPAVGNFRINIFRQRGTISLVVRYVRSDIPSFEQLKLPPVLLELVMEKRGLVLIAGATGSGKSTTLAAMIDHRNTQKTGHILTIEDPIEYLFRHKKSIVNQRELTVDTLTYTKALANALREAPDLIMIGEIRDRETMQHALLHTLTGHLCLATLHANNSYHALSRIINMFPYDARSGLLSDLSIGLRAIVSQRLVRNKDGGLQPAVEILLNSSLIAELVKNGEITQIKEAMEKSLYPGSQTFEQALCRLYIDESDHLRRGDDGVRLVDEPRLAHQPERARRRASTAWPAATTPRRRSRRRQRLHRAADRAGDAGSAALAAVAFAAARAPACASRASRLFPHPAWIRSTPPASQRLLADTLALTRALIERRSLTPDDAGCQELIASRLAPLGFRAETLVVELRPQRLAAPRNRPPARLLRRPHRRRADGSADGMAVRSVRADRARRLALRPRRRRHEGLARGVRHGDRGVRRGASGRARLDRAPAHVRRGRSVDRRHGQGRREARGRGRAHRLLRRRRADVGRSARRHDQERPARHAVGHADRQGHPGPRRLSAARAESDPSRRTRPRGARGDALGRRQCLLPADDLAVLQRPRGHRCDERHSRRARSHVQFPVLPGQHPRIAGAALRGASWRGTGSTTISPGPASARRISPGAAGWSTS